MQNTPSKPANPQTALPGIIAGSPVECSGADLAATIREIEAQGFDVTRMAVKGSRYTLTLQRRCACDICRELSQPSEHIEDVLKPAEAARPAPASAFSEAGTSTCPTIASRRAYGPGR